MRYFTPFEYFQAVARAGSVRKAAEDLAITSSALNRRIQDLEIEMGTPLFDRHVGGLRLNAAGELAMHFAQTQRQEVAKLRSQLAEIQGLKRGHIAFASTQALTAHDLPQAIAAFAAAHPGVTFSHQTLRGRQEEEWLREQKIEFAISLGRVRGPDFETLLSVPRTIAAAVPHDHPLAAEAELRLSQLVHLPHVVPHGDFRMRELLEHGFARQNLPLPVQVEFDDFDMGQALAAEGTFVSFRLLSQAGERENGRKARAAKRGYALIPIALRDLPLVELQVLKLRKTRLSPIADAFVRLLGQYLPMD